MKTIGMIGGMSWESTAEYYRIINEVVNDRLGGVHSASCLIYSFDFAEIEALQAEGDWDTATFRMINAARQLERGGADGLIICTNTMHRMADDVQNAVDIPLIHIADPTAAAIKEAGIKDIGLLGTRYTMEQDFYRGRLENDHELQVIVPNETDRAQVNHIIYHELVLGVINESSRLAYEQVIERLIDGGAQGIIFGCTEIGLLVHEEDCIIPAFDTTRLHALAAVDWALDS